MQILKWYEIYQYFKVSKKILHTACINALRGEAPIHWEILLHPHLNGINSKEREGRGCAVTLDICEHIYRFPEQLFCWALYLHPIWGGN